jgi:hypothetical protein
LALHAIMCNGWKWPHSVMSACWISGICLNSLSEGNTWQRSIRQYNCVWHVYLEMFYWYCVGGNYCSFYMKPDYIVPILFPNWEIWLMILFLNADILFSDIFYLLQIRHVSACASLFCLTVYMKCKLTINDAYWLMIWKYW